MSGGNGLGRRPDLQLTVKTGQRQAVQEEARRYAGAF